MTAIKSSARLLWLAFALIAVASGTFCLTAAAHLFPAMGQDSASHLVPILNYKAGQGLGAVVWSLTRDYDPTGHHRFLQYPPLFHVVTAGLIRHASYRDIYLCLGIFAVLGLACYIALILQKQVAGTARGKPLWVALACLSLGAVSTWFYQLPAEGRAEALATPLLILGSIAVLRSRGWWQAVTAGVFIGILGATQTAVACLAGLLYSIYVSVGQVPENTGVVRRWLKLVGTAAAVSLVVFAACSLCSPYPLLDTVQGIAFHLSRLPVTTASFTAYFLFPAIRATFYGLFLAVLLAHYLWWRGRRLHWLGLANLAVFVLAAWVLSIHHPTRYYNLLSFTPVFVALALKLVAQLDGAFEPTATPPPQPRWTGLIYAVYFGVFALMSIGVLRQAAIYTAFIQKGVDYDEAERAFLQQIPPNDPTPILFDNGMAALLTRYDHAYQRLSDFARLDPVPEPAKPILVVHQWYGRMETPPQIAGYRLVWDDFIKQPPPTVLGLKVGNAVPGYAFAIYRPLAPDPVSSR